MKNKYLFFILFLFFFSCAQNRVEVVRYKNFYDFGSVLRIKSLQFKPFPDNIAFKTKNTLIFLKSKKKYTFYSVIYSYNNYCRIFSYALFGKKIGDIFFKKNIIFFVPSKDKEVYIINVKNKDLKESIFNFLKDIVKGIVIDNVYLEDKCYKGFYNKNLAKVCLDSGFKTLFIENKIVHVEEIKNGFTKRLTINFGSKIMKIEVKEEIKPEKDPEKIFFDSIKNYKRYYIKDLLHLEKVIFMESKNENK